MEGLEHRESVLVPVKSFAAAKIRLSPALSAPERTDLARWMASRVLAAAKPLPVAVACDDAEVAEWAEANGASVVWTPERGLNGAVQDGVASLARSGFARVIVAHGDLPMAAGLTGLVGRRGVVLVGDRHHDGTNVAAVPARAGFRFSYGPGSLARHVAEARRLRLVPQVLSRPALEWDVDVPADLEQAPDGLDWPLRR